MIRIDCLKNFPVKIEDLGLVVRPGQSEWIDEDRALTSECLTSLKRTGHLQVSSGMRSRVSNPPQKPSSIHTVRMSRPASGAANAARPLTAVPNDMVVANKTNDKEDLKAMLQTVALEAARIATAAMSTQPTPAPAIDLEAMIERAVAKALSAHSQAPQPHVSVPTGYDEPVYIPSGIVSAEKVDVKLTSGSSDNSGLDEAAKSLKALKGKRDGNKAK